MGNALPERPQALRVHFSSPLFSLGTVTIYAYMQSVGLVNDHARFCFRYKELTR
jgi:3-methyladenine DNA glycosylase Tag